MRRSKTPPRGPQIGRTLKGIACALFLACGEQAAAQDPSVTMNATLNIEPRYIEIDDVQDIFFGGILVPDGSGPISVTMSLDGTITATGGAQPIQLYREVSVGEVVVIGPFGTTFTTTLQSQYEIYNGLIFTPMVDVPSSLSEVSEYGMPTGQARIRIGGTVSIPSGFEGGDYMYIQFEVVHQ